MYVYVRVCVCVTRGDDLNYTEKEKKGIDRVERMNSFFDRLLMPAIGVLIIMLLLSFTVNRFKEKYASGPSVSSGSSANASQQTAEPRVFGLRKKLLAAYGDYKREFAAYGYEPADGYAYDLSLRKTVDEEMSIFQFSDATLGDLTIINYFPGGQENSYDSLSLTVSSGRLINVTVKRGEEQHRVTFTSPDFTAYRAEDAEEFKAMMLLVGMDEITTMYEIFETDIGNLAASCGFDNG